MRWILGAAVTVLALAGALGQGLADGATGGSGPAQATPQPPAGAWAAVHAPNLSPLWTNNPPTLRGIQVVNTAEGPLGYAVGDSGALARYDGQSWRKLDDLEPRATAPLTYHLNDVFIIAADDVWVVGAMAGDRLCGNEQCGVLLRYDGRRWTVIDKTSYGLPGRVPPMRAIDMIQDADGQWHGWIVGDDLLTDTLKALIMRFRDGRWRVWTGPNNFARNLHDVKMLSPGEAWLVGEAGVESWYTEREPGQGSWAPLGKSGADDLFALDLADPLYGWDGGANGRMNRYKGSCHDTDLSTQCWFDNQARPIRAGPSAPQALSPTVYDIDMLSREEAWLVGAALSRRTTVAYLESTRELWYIVDVRGDPGQNLMALSMLSSRRGWAVGERGTILEYVDDSAPTPTAAATEPPPVTATPSASPTAPVTDTPSPGMTPTPTAEIEATPTEGLSPTATDDPPPSATDDPLPTATDDPTEPSPTSTTPPPPPPPPSPTPEASATSAPRDGEGRLFLPFALKPRVAGRP